MKINSILIKIKLIILLSLCLYGNNESIITINGKKYLIPYKYQLEQFDSTMTYSQFYVKNEQGIIINNLSPYILAKLYSSSNMLTEIFSYDYSGAYDTMDDQSFRAYKEVENTVDVNVISSYASNLSSFIISNIDVAVATSSCAAAIAGTTLTFGAGVALAVPVCTYAATQLPSTISSASDTVLAIGNDMTTIKQTHDYSNDLLDAATQFMTLGNSYLNSVENYKDTTIIFNYNDLSKMYFNLLKAIPYVQFSIDINNQIRDCLIKNGNIYKDTAIQVGLSSLSKIPVVGKATYFTGTSTSYSIYKDATNNQIDKLDKVKETIVSGINNESVQYDKAYFSSTKLAEYENYFKSLIKPLPITSFTLNKTSANVGDTITATATSSDPDGDSLTYQWQLTKPDATFPTISTSSSTSFTVNQEGKYTLFLTVSDGVNEPVIFSDTISVAKTYPNVEMDIEDDGDKHVYLTNIYVGSCGWEKLGEFIVPTGEKWKSIKIAGSREDILLVAKWGSAPEPRDYNWNSMCKSGYNIWDRFRGFKFDFHEKTSIITYNSEHEAGEKLYIYAYSPDRQEGGEVSNYSVNSIVKVSYDADNDGVPNNKDDFPNDPNKQYDSDKDGIDDKADKFPNDKAAAIDEDEDDHPDKWNYPNPNDSTKTTIVSITGLKFDKFPNDRAAAIDDDDDGYPNKWNNGKTQADSTTGLILDEFTNDPTEWVDSDGDGVGNNADKFYNDKTEWNDSDGDGIGDNQDAAPNDKSRITNATPIINDIPVLKIDVGDTLSVDLDVTDADNDTVTLKIVSVDNSILDFISISGNQLNIDASNISDSTKTFFIEATDSYGAKALKAVAIIITNNTTSIQKEYSINIDTNWTFISLSSAATLHIDDIDNTHLKIIRSYQNGQWYVWTYNSQPSTEQTLTELTENNGYWIKSDAPTTITYIGLSLPTPIDFSAQNGEWKMYGSTQIDDPNLFFTNHPNITILWKYTNGEWQAISRDSDINSDLAAAGIETLYFINSNEGFWAK